MLDSSSRQLVYKYSLVGYGVSLILMGAAMKNMERFFLATVVPYLVATFFVEKWMTPKVIRAATTAKAIAWSMAGAALVGFFTIVLTVLFSVLVVEQITGQHSMAVQEIPVAILIYVAVGMLYCIPGILLGGYFLGTAIYNRHHD